jgi:hypothetical protein
MASVVSGWTFNCGTPPTFEIQDAGRFGQVVAVPKTYLSSHNFSFGTLSETL